MPLLLAAGACALAVVWALLVFSLGSGAGEGSAEEGKSASRAGRDNNPRTGERSAQDLQQQPASSGAAAGRTQRSSEAGQSPSSSGQNPSSYSSSGEGPGPRRGQQEKSTGAGGEPGDYDPLGKKARPGTLTQTGKDRLKLAAGQFVSAAYGYSGEVRADYTSGVAKTVAAPEFWDSKGGGQVEELATTVESKGLKSAAKMERFEIERTSAKEAAGYAYFTQGSSYTRYGGIEGEETKDYRQKLTLRRASETSWEVISAGVVERIESSGSSSGDAARTSARQRVGPDHNVPAGVFAFGWDARDARRRSPAAGGAPGYVRTLGCARRGLLQDVARSTSPAACAPRTVVILPDYRTIYTGGSIPRL